MTEQLEFNTFMLLSQREVEVLTLYARGLQRTEVARALGLGKSTVKFHASNLLRKLDVSTMPHAVAVSMRMGIIN